MVSHRLAFLAAVVFAAGGLAAGRAHSAEVSSEAGNTTFALPAVTLEWSEAGGSGDRLASIHPYPRDRRYEPRRPYEPRRYESRRSSSITPYFQLHGGVFDPEGGAENHWLMGFRAGQSYDAVQIGVGADWLHRAFTEETVVAETVDPSGHVITQSIESFRTSSNLVPMLGFIQVMAPSELPIRPYFGLGGGYEVLFLDSENFVTGEDHSGVFHGWGWQAWGGAALPLGPRSRLTGEAFVNTSTVKRDVDRFEVGQPVRESVDVDGMGVRIGLQVGF